MTVRNQAVQHNKRITGVHPKIIGYVALGWAVVLGMMTVTYLLEPLPLLLVVAVLCIVLFALLLISSLVLEVCRNREKSRKGDEQ